MNARFQTRRDFIKTTAIAAAAAPFAGALTPQAFAADPDKKLGVALVGLGSLSTHQIAPALQQTKYCRLAGLVTGTPAKAEKWKAQYNIPDRSIYNYDTMEKMADNPDIDIVYVVTPNGLHAEHTIKAANAGKHVLCEKPMEATSEKCRQMIDACKQAGRQLAIAYRCRFDPHHLECIRLAREKVLGGLRIVEAAFEIRLDQPPGAWRFHKALSGGGCLMDVGIYALQATRFITGEEPVLVSGIATGGLLVYGLICDAIILEHVREDKNTLKNGDCDVFTPKCLNLIAWPEGGPYSIQACKDCHGNFDAKLIPTPPGA